MRFLHSTMQHRPVCFQSKSYLENGYHIQTHMETQWWMLMIRVAAVKCKPAAQRDHSWLDSRESRGVRAYLQEGNDEWSQREVGGLVQFRVKIFDGESGILGKGKSSFAYRLILLSLFHWHVFWILLGTHHQPQHKAAHSLSDLRRYVVAKLLQCGQKALQLAELPGTASWRELLVGKGGSWGHGRPITEAVRSGWSTIKRCRRVTAPIQHCQETEWRDDMNRVRCFVEAWGVCDRSEGVMMPEAPPYIV